MFITALVRKGTSPEQTKVLHFQQEVLLVKFKFGSFLVRGGEQMERTVENLLQALVIKPIDLKSILSQSVTKSQLIFTVFPSRIRWLWVEIPMFSANRFLDHATHTNLPRS